MTVTFASLPCSRDLPMETMRDHFLRGYSYQSSRMYPVVKRFSLSYSEAYCIRNQKPSQK